MYGPWRCLFSWEKAGRHFRGVRTGSAGCAPRERATRGAGSSLSLTLLGAGPDAHGVARRIEAIEDSSGLPRSLFLFGNYLSVPPRM